MLEVYYFCKMIRKQINNYIINISSISALFDINDIQKYSSIYIGASDYNYSSVILIEIYKDEELLTNSVVAENYGATTIHDTAVIFEHDRVLICCSNFIYCLNIPSLSLLWKMKADSITCLQIFKHKELYIVHGELEISCLNYNGKILWQQGGEDIFVRLNSDENDFYLMEDYIVARDWNNKLYKIDYTGNVLN